MSEIKDPAIKLFGKTIPLSEKSDHLASAPDSSSQTQSDEKDACGDAEHAVVDHMKGPAEEPCERKCSSVSCNSKEEENSQALLQDNKTMAEPTPEENMETDSSSQEKALKKPDKILPCPRCNSLDTKFCYYNNYNVNQPRHFCKNCQRYWTAGGTMRNVPVGAGRRKNKHANSHYRPIMMASDRIPNAPDAGDNQALLTGICTPPMPVTGNGTILKFGPDAPLCESMANMLNLGDPKRKVEMGAHCAENGEDPSCGPSVSTLTCLEKELPKHVDKELCKGFTPTHPMQCYGGPTWPYPYPWNISSMAAGRCSSELAYGPEAGNLSAVQWGLPQMMAPPPFCAPNIPFPFVAAHPSYWGCMPGWPGGPWSVPWVPPNGWASPSSSSNNGCSGNGSLTLGKHSRDGNLQLEEKPEKCLWVPKTLRIDDPDEAAKSSIWTTLGIKPEQNGSINKGGLFKSYKPNTVDKEHISDASQVLQANPAALSRSQTFQESNT